MDTLYRRLLLVSLLAVFTFSVQAQPQMRPDATTLPQPLHPTPTLGDVDIERIDAPGVAVAQDHRGFMWFAGFNNGLFRYDGYGYTRYQHDPEDSTTLSHNRLEYRKSRPRYAVFMVREDVCGQFSGAATPRIALQASSFHVTR